MDVDSQAEQDRLNRELTALENLDDDEITPETMRRAAAVHEAIEDLGMRVDARRAAALAEGVRSGNLRLESGTPSGDPYVHERGGTRSAALRCLDSAVHGDRLPTRAAELLEKLVDSGPQFAQSWVRRYISAAGDPAYEGAYSKMLCDPARGHLRWDATEQAAYARVAALRTEQRAMGESATHGSELVPLTLDPQVLLTSAGSVNPLRAIARTVITATDAWQGVTSAGVTAEWLSEGSEASDASPTLAGPSIPVFKLGVFVPLSYELFEDATGLLTELGRLMRDAYDQLTNEAFTLGTGEGQPTGLITGAVAASGTVSLVTPSTGESFTAPDLYKLQTSLPPRWQARAQWCANLARLNDARQFETENGSLKFPSLQDNPPTLLGRPANELSNMDGSDISASETKNHYSWVYGSFADAFVIVERLGATTELITNLFGENRRTTGQRGVFLWARTGSALVVPQALRVLSIPTTA
jgi:HK97 family phage major capsid protein